MKLRFDWQIREYPLLPAAVFVPVETRHKLLLNLLERDDESLQALTGVLAKNGILIIVDNENLPWINNCVYLGKDNGASHLYINTQYEPSVPVGLLDAAIYKKFKQVVAILPEQKTLIPVDNAKPLAREAIEQYI